MENMQIETQVALAAFLFFPLRRHHVTTLFQPQHLVPQFYLQHKSLIKNPIPDEPFVSIFHFLQMNNQYSITCLQ